MGCDNVAIKQRVRIYVVLPSVAGTVSGRCTYWLFCVLRAGSLNGLGRPRAASFGEYRGRNGVNLYAEDARLDRAPVCKTGAALPQVGSIPTLCTNPAGRLIGIGPRVVNPKNVGSSPTPLTNVKEKE